jgi:NADPH-dependent 2,4-dienoyl-CoA reductase/sulfur reductase-like enzyme
MTLRSVLSRRSSSYNFISPSEYLHTPFNFQLKISNYSRSRNMKVIIVGGGIAGLAAAIGLRQAGHRVQV